MAGRHQDRHLAQRRRQRRVEADLRAELLREIAHDGRAQHDVERAVRCRARPVEHVAHHGFLRFRHLRPLKWREPVADELGIEIAGRRRSLRGKLSRAGQQTQGAEPRDDGSTTHGLTP